MFSQRIHQVRKIVRGGIDEINMWFYQNNFYNITSLKRKITVMLRGHSNVLILHYYLKHVLVVGQFMQFRALHKNQIEFSRIMAYNRDLTLTYVKSKYPRHCDHKHDSARRTISAKKCIDSSG